MTITRLTLIVGVWGGVNGFVPGNWVTRSHEQHRRLSFLLEKPSVNGDSVDRAPCFDSICSSDPPVEVLDDTVPNAPSVSRRATPGQAIQRLGDLSGPTVWSEFGRLAQQWEGTVTNLGQGFPDWLPPDFCNEALVEALSQQGTHQYTRTAGHVPLVQRLAGRYSAHLQREIDPMSEVAVTVGASQALYLSLQTLLQEGDEVILFEPFFDLYENQIKLAGGRPVYVPLEFVPYENDPVMISGGEWKLDVQALQQAITPRTRALILNSPHNPTGKVFSRQEMMDIAHVVESLPNCVVLTDEVYKYIIHAPLNSEEEEEEVHRVNGNTVYNDVYSPVGHVHFASLPNMYDRTITISSAGKTFSATGWQLGWTIGPPHLIGPIHRLLPYVQFCASTVMQEALARALPRADEPYQGYSSYYAYLKEMYTAKRDKLGLALKASGLAVPDFSRTAGGGFFYFCRIGPDVAAAIPSQYLGAANPATPSGYVRQDWALCQWLAEEMGLICIPSSPFFSQQKGASGVSDEFIRVAFCKSDDVIARASQLLLSIGQTPRAERLLTNGESGTAASSTRTFHNVTAEATTTVMVGRKR